MTKKPEENGLGEERKNDCCVCINVYTKCEEDKCWKKEEHYTEEKTDCCVCINVYTKCEEDPYIERI